MAKTDRMLGQRVQEQLRSLGVETPMILNNTNTLKAKTALHHGISKFMEHMGLDVCDDSLIDTPTRVTDMYVKELFMGLNYENFPKCTAHENKMGYDQVVIVKGIETLSVCEHHFQTIDGFTHIGYIPRNKVMGLSKFARITDFFARRPQVQERMTEQIYAALNLILETDDIIVVQSCVHYCMKARGAMQNQSRTITSKLGGRFLEKDALRQEFFNDIKS